MFYTLSRRYRFRRFAVLRSMPLSSAPNSCAVISRCRSRAPSSNGIAYVPSSSRLLQTARPSRSQYKIFTRSLRRLVNTNTCPSHCAQVAYVCLVYGAAGSSFPCSCLQCGNLFRSWLKIEILGSVIGTATDDSAFVAPLHNFQIGNSDPAGHFFQSEQSFFAQSLATSFETGFLADGANDTDGESTTITGTESSSIQNLYDFLIIMRVQ